ncbi:TadE/TadG family type IV pilus assembly protein [Pseudodesulfovibrio senegalensis]|jgi:Flp pilus assembly protein TadG|uniref:Pilus assembly protein n=1 Tax=Pseudodesulfovibrio senegalensis TaxID=1721087 RepID=A0A6N6N2C9_9BACT|nr:TadE family protein [Pseudodesulfovibrio senegalensis]KAB1441818.1 pilus assembly protein [Pseudodesulfovibrio senegalensis]
MNRSRHNDHERSAGSRAGATAVEVGLLLPIVFMLIMGVIESGALCYSWLTVQRAAQEGARFAATGQGYEEGTRKTRIVEATSAMLDPLENGQKIITMRSWPDHSATGDGVEGNPGEPCQVVEVRVVYKYTPFTPLVSNMLPEVITLLGSGRKVNEPWYPCERASEGG